MEGIANSGLVHKLLSITALGSEWVLWLLIALSIYSVGIMIERALYFMRTRVGFDAFAAKLFAHLEAGRVDEAEKLCAENQAIECRVALHGLRNRDLGAEGMSRAMNGLLISERSRLDRGLVVLGTLGNNTPFIGLFGTVIGIIMAFKDLSLNPAGGSAVVMAGISEALIATAVGLVVAIPAVIAFNAFQRVVKRRMANAAAVQEIVLAHHRLFQAQTKKAA